MSSGVFSYDSPFGQWMGKIWDLLILNFLCLLCCVLVVTAGASVTALHYVTLKMAENRESGICRSFFKAFKQNFGQSVLLELALLALLAAVRMGLGFVMPGRPLSYLPGPVRFILFFMLMAVLIATVITALYVFAVQARFVNTPGTTVKNAFLMAVGHLPFTVSMVIIDAAFYYIAGNFATWLVFWIVSGPVYLNSLFLCRVFQKYMPEEKDG